MACTVLNGNSLLWQAYQVLRHGGVKEENIVVMVRICPHLFFSAISSLAIVTYRCGGLQLRWHTQA